MKRDKRKRIMKQLINTRIYTQHAGIVRTNMAFGQYHNIADKDIYRPHSWCAFGTKDPEAADYRACANYGEIYK